MAILFRNDNGKVVARTKNQDTVIYKKCVKSKHMLRNPLGWAFDKSIIAQANLLGVKEAWIEDKESGMVFKAPIILFSTSGVPVSRGYGEQVCLPLSYWKTEKARY